MSSNDNPPVIVEVSVLVSTPWWLRKIAWSVYHQRGGGGSVQPFQGQPENGLSDRGAKDVPYDEIIKALNLLHSRV